MVCWLVARNNETGDILEKRAFRSADEAEHYQLTLNEKWNVPIWCQILWLPFGEFPQ